MSTDLNPCQSTMSNGSMPQPGELWHLNQGGICMIVHEPLPVQNDAPCAISVMLCSTQTEFQSDIDPLIPRAISGHSQDLLAHTWQVFTLLATDLDQAAGIRLSRVIYDCLMDIGDRHHQVSTNQVEANSTLNRETETTASITTLHNQANQLGLSISPPGSSQQPPIQAFHQTQRIIADRLQNALKTAQQEFYARRATEQIIDAAILQETELDLSATPLAAVQAGWIRLGEWLSNQTETISQGWAVLSPGDQTWQVAAALRGNPVTPNDQIIEQWLAQLGAAATAMEQQQAALTLGDRLPANAPQKPAVIQALINLLQTTTDNETLWTAVESLWKIDPGNPAAGVRRVKLIDLGMQVAGNTIALAAAIVPQGSVMAVLLQLYSSERGGYLPPDLQMTLFDQEANMLRQLTARQSDLYMQLKLTAEPGERFSVRISLDTAELTENFIL